MPSSIAVSFVEVETVRKGIKAAIAMLTRPINGNWRLELQ